MRRSTSAIRCSHTAPPDSPGGVTVDIARELGARLGIPVELVCFGAARDSFASMAAGRADICFLAVDPARQETVAFTAPYVVIEGVFAVPDDSPLTSAADVDRPGVRVGVKKGSAYDLFLTRTLAHAEVVRGSEGTTVFVEQELEVAAGIRQPVVGFVAAHPGTAACSNRVSWRSSRLSAPPVPGAIRRSASCTPSSRS